MTEQEDQHKKRSIEHTLVRAIAGHSSDDLFNRMLVFIHLPKCAGRTFSSILDARFVATRSDDEQGCWVRGTVYGQYLGAEKDETLCNLETVDRDSVYLRGHLPVGVFDDFNRTPAYITMLREPAAQTQSLYRFGVERGGWKNGTAVADLVDRGLMIDNPQTRQLAGLQTASASCTEVTLNTALNNLKDFLFVGKAEQFEIGLQVLLSRVGGPGALYHSRGSGKAIDLAPDIKSDLDDLTVLDKKLCGTVPDLEPDEGTQLPNIVVDSIIMKSKESSTLTITEREIADARKALESQGHTMRERP
jgi:hypothetical protein